MKINEIEGINENILNKGNKVEAIVEVYGEDHSKDEVLTEFYIPESNFEYKNEYREKKPLSSNSNSIKQQYKKNKKAGIVSCPKCGSTSITTSNKKLSVKRGVAGAIIGTAVPGVGNAIGAAAGAVAGGLSSKKIYNICMNCGHKWKL